MASTNKNIRIKLIQPLLRNAWGDNDGWQCNYEILDENWPIYGIYESESTQERYSGLPGSRLGSTVPDDLRRYIHLSAVAPEINLTEGEILKLIEVIPVHLTRKQRKIDRNKGRK